MSGACWSTVLMMLILFFRPLPFMVRILIVSLAWGAVLVVL
jgi:hypothetical protein